MLTPIDVLVVGAGPAGLALAAALCQAGLTVAGVAPAGEESPWPNTYGIWEDELPSPLWQSLLAHRWHDAVAYANHTELPLQRVYGLFDNARLQTRLLAPCQQAGMRWHRQPASSLTQQHRCSRVRLADGTLVDARLVVDASGHTPRFVRRPPGPPVAWQAAYGIVGRFTHPPVRDGQLVLMDFRADHLDSQVRRQEPPTFLYAMDLGKGRYFVEETSLAHSPALPFEQLQARLHRRLNHMGCAVAALEHEEHCLFPMNLPIPDPKQPLLGYGAAASMVHPASGYQIGAALRAAPTVAAAVAQALRHPDTSPGQAAAAGWQALWPSANLRRHSLYLFGLQTLLAFNESQTQQFFATFFRLPQPSWAGYLSNTLSLGGVLHTMARVFRAAPTNVRSGLMAAAFRSGFGRKP